MDAFLLTHEVPVRLGAFLGIFAAMAVWEVLAPRRALHERKSLRWTNNLALTVLNSVLVRALLPVAAIGVAGFAAERGMGVLNIVNLPQAWAIVVSVLTLDAAIYLQHLMFHAVPLFWRLHRVHHADVDFDVTTGARFHPIEIALSMLIKFAVILVLGPPVVAVLIFEVLLNATSMFNHGNVRLPVRIDRVLRWLVVTPDMHRVHHSIDPSGDQQQLRVQRAVVGPSVRHLPGAAPGRARRDDDRHRAVPRAAGAVARPDAAATVSP